MIWKYLSNKSQQFQRMPMPSYSVISFYKTYTIYAPVRTLRFLALSPSETSAKNFMFHLFDKQLNCLEFVMSKFVLVLMFNKECMWIKYMYWSVSRTNSNGLIHRIMKQFYRKSKWINIFQNYFKLKLYNYELNKISSNIFDGIITFMDLTKVLQLSVILWNHQYFRDSITSLILQINCNIYKMTE